MTFLIQRTNFVYFCEAVWEGPVSDASHKVTSSFVSFFGNFLHDPYFSFLMFYNLHLKIGSINAPIFGRIGGMNLFEYFKIIL